MKIGFIGAGNMGGSILKGYAPVAREKADEIFVFDVNEEKREQLAADFEAVTACDGLEQLVEKSDCILLGVKPNLFEEVLPAVAKKYTEDKLIISMAAGINIGFIQQYLGEKARIIRIMPNTPAMVNEAMIAVCRNDRVDDKCLADAFALFSAIGRAEEITEDLFHCVIGVSGSSPAYTYMYIDALIGAAVANGMEPEQAKVFAAQAVLGAAKMVLESDVSPEQLRINVCSPGGTTIEAVNALFANGFEENVKEGFQAAVEKSKEMTK